MRLPSARGPPVPRPFPWGAPHPIRTTQRARPMQPTLRRRAGIDSCRRPRRTLGPRRGSPVPPRRPPPALHPLERLSPHPAPTRPFQTHSRIIQRGGRRAPFPPTRPQPHLHLALKTVQFRPFRCGARRRPRKRPTTNSPTLVPRTLRGIPPRPKKKDLTHAGESGRRARFRRVVAEIQQTWRWTDTVALRLSRRKSG